MTWGLESLELEATSVTNLKPLKDLRELKDLSLPESVSAAQVEAMKRAIPGIDMDQD